MGSELDPIINKNYTSSFRLSFSFLPRDQREAIKIVYNFCRVSDEIVDGNFEYNTKLKYLNDWKSELDYAINSLSKYKLLNNLIKVAKKFRIPINYFYDLISGVEMDLYKNRYNTFDELEKYCRLVASSVGLIIVRIFCNSNQRIDAFATNLGIAFQLTNILRDLKDDANMNRIYIPYEDLRKFNYSEDMLLRCVYNKEFVKLMEFETKRAESYYEKANNILTSEDAQLLFVPIIMEQIYYRALRKIKHNNYDVFNKKVYISKLVQFLIATKYFLKLKLFQKL